MKGRRSQFEIYWEILVYCRTARSFTAIVNRCDLNSKTGQDYISFLCTKGFLEKVNGGDKTLFKAASGADEYTTLFAGLYQKLFDRSPGFRL